MTPKIIEIEGAEPITIDEARQHLEAHSYGDSDVDPNDDTMIEAMLYAAREHCENFLGLSLTTRTLEIALDEFPKSYHCHTQPYHYRHNRNHPLDIELPMGPVREVLSVSWGDESDDELTAADFTLDNYSPAARITPVAGYWPTVARATNVVKVRYLAGYGVDSDGGEALPKVIRAAILLTLGDLYANRESSGANTITSLPTSAEALMRPLRVRLGMA